MQNLEETAPKMAKLLQFSSKVIIIYLFIILLTFALVDLGYFINSSRGKNAKKLKLAW